MPEDPLKNITLRVENNARFFNVQRPIGGGLLNEGQEAMIPTSILKQLLKSTIENQPLPVQQAFKELKRIMQTEI